MKVQTKTNSIQKEGNSKRPSYFIFIQTAKEFSLYNKIQMNFLSSQIFLWNEIHIGENVL